MNKEIEHAIIRAIAHVSEKEWIVNEDLAIQTAKLRKTLETLKRLYSDKGICSAKRGV